MNDINVNLTEQLYDLCKELRIEIYGAGGVDRFKDAPEGHRPEQLLPGAKTVFSIALPVLPATYDWDRRLRTSELFPDTEITPIKKTNPPTRKEIVEHVRTELGINEYRSMYDLVSSRLDIFTYEIGRFLLAQGYDTLWYPTSSPILISQAAVGGNSTWRSKYQYGAFSQTVAGYNCGVGTIGLSHVLLTKKYGPRIRLNSVITTAGLVESPIMEDLCTKCGLCVRNCPVKAFGKNKVEIFNGKKITTAEFDKCMCLNSRNVYHSELSEDNIFDHVQNCDCGGLCVKTCPIGTAPKPFQKPFKGLYGNKR